MLKSCYSMGLLEAGCDEAGRGCLAGPVVAAAVILPPDIQLAGLNDSKKLTAIQRSKLDLIIRGTALAYRIAWADNVEIDRINILEASITAMHRALEGLSLEPEHILVDGNRFRPYRNIPHTCIVRGDSLYASIAAASVLAKQHRDELMRNFAKEYPHYGWHRNYGYPTAEHRRAIQKLGLTPQHRRSFRFQPL